MDARFEGFLKMYLDDETGRDTSGYLRSTLKGFDESYVEAVRGGFIQILEDESFGPHDYERLTNVDFPDVDSLRTYLRDLYAYLFEGAQQQPELPE
ncbi:hypothetical protein [Streptomyces erythrochromogenes]|uniref:hypothetical protein n=1 Tax=Streptomyces erythrochromogenes TaxID=285574 RepID=UPI00380255B6